MTRERAFQQPARRFLRAVGIVTLASVAWLMGALAFSATPAPAAPTRLVCSSISSKILGRAVSYCVDLPADYGSTTRRYPTLYFLHGLFENYHSWDENGGKEILDDLLRQGKLGPFLVVLPNADNTFYVNAYSGHDNYEDFFIKELVPTIDRMYRTIPQRQERGISGVSMGGYGALHLAMLHPDIFGSVSAQGAALVKFPSPIPTTGRWGFYVRVAEHSFGNPLNEAYWIKSNPLTLAEHPERFTNLQIYFDCGTHDRYGFEKGAELLDQILNQHDFQHVFALRPGNHGWGYLAKYMKYSLFFEWRCFQAGERSGAGAPGGATH
ncbi:MAG: alpha/beta hydrolase [Terriglobia bacterium]